MEISGDRFYSLKKQACPIISYHCIWNTKLCKDCSQLLDIPYSGNLLREEIFANPAILLSEEIFAIFDFNLLGDFRD